MKDLTKAFDCLSYELLLVKLHTYGFNITALSLIQSYLTNRKHRSLANLSCSPWEELLFGTEHSGNFIVQPLCDLFFMMNETDIASN